MVAFAHSPQSTIGVEWELALTNKTDGELAPRAEQVLARLGEQHPHLLVPSTESVHVTGEFLNNTLEVITGVCTTVAESCRQLAEAVDALRPICDELGLDFFCAGTHPYSRWAQQTVVNKDRYQRVVNRAQYWGRHMIIFGVHVHVGVDSPQKALAVVDALTNYCPHLLAPSVSSPFWEGIDTGYASHRTMLYQQLPSNGLPFSFQTWEQYSAYLDSQVTTGAIEDVSEDRWDVRPVPHYGTVEMRYCDGLASLPDVAGIVALTQCLVEYFSRRFDAGERVQVLDPWHAQENKWRAARYGLDAQVVVSNEPRVRPLRDELKDLLDMLRPVAEDLECLPELEQMRRILAEGTGADRQRRVLAQTGSFREVMRDLAEQAQQPPLR